MRTMWYNPMLFINYGEAKNIINIKFATRRFLESLQFTNCLLVQLIHFCSEKKKRKIRSFSSFFENIPKKTMKIKEAFIF